MATKKSSKAEKAKLRRPKVKKSVADQAQTIAELRQQLAECLRLQSATASENMHLLEALTQKDDDLDKCNSELSESLERQIATSEILRVIASSPADIQSVLDTIAARAARLCDAIDAVIFRHEDNFATAVAWYGSMPRTGPTGEIFPDTRGTPAGRAMLDQITIHVHDITTEFETEYPDSKARHQISGSRTIVATPLLREGVCIGAIMIRRTEVRPFTERQIALLKTFADQAVIAIENVRLFNELKESLEQQTATSEILGVIASSQTDLQPVLAVIVRNAARVCGAENSTIFMASGNVMRVAARTRHGSRQSGWI